MTNSTARLLQEVTKHLPSKYNQDLRAGKVTKVMEYQKELGELVKHPALADDRHSNWCNRAVDCMQIAGALDFAPAADWLKANWR